MSPEIIRISEIVGGPHWVDPSEGQKVYELTVQRLKDGGCACLDFGGKDFVITAFLNSAIGPLFNGDLTQDQLDRLKFSRTTPDDDDLIKRVIENAISYYANKSDIDDAWSDEFDEE